MTIDFDKLESMEGTQIGGATKFIKYTDCKAGDVIVLGKYLGTVPNKFNKDKPNFKFEVKGKKTVVLPASGQLNFSLENLEIGSLVRITYLGREVMTKGTFKGKEANAFNVELLGEPSEEVSPQKELPLSNQKAQTSNNPLDNLE